MAEVKVYYDRAGSTLTVWFGNPQDEAVAEETGDEIILMTDRAKPKFSLKASQQLRIAFETLAG